MFFQNNYFYYITIGLQAFCVIHCLRRRSQYSWIWLIVFLPFIGSLAYLFMEVFNRNSVQQVQSGMSNTLYPAGRIKKLGKQLQFSDTFNNRIALADVYLASGDATKAIEIYETSLTGAFTDNEHVLMQLVAAYFQVGRYADAIKVARKVYTKPAFINSRQRVLYAMALDKAGETELAEKEFSSMKGKYSYFEARYQYGLFLLNRSRNGEAKNIFADIVAEFPYLTSFEKRNNRYWFTNAKQELKKLAA